MRLDIGFDDDLRPVGIEQASDRAPKLEPPKQEPLVKPGPLDRRAEELKERAAESRFPKIPRRKYERRQALPITNEPGERHVRARHHLQPGLSGLRLRPEEKALLGEVGRFRIITLKDAAKTLYKGNENALRSDLRFLRKNNLVSLDTVNARRDGRGRSIERIEVITLTLAGERQARMSNPFSPDQKLYHGLVKPREAEHDAQIYRACRKEWEQIEKKGGRSPRILLDFELKSQIQKAIHAARKAEPERDLQRIKEQVAAEHELPVVDGQIQIPDARIEYELDQGSRTGHSDVEVLTAAYHPGHLRAKVQAGFHVYVSGRDAATLTAKIEGEHHLLDHVLDL